MNVPTWLMPHRITVEPYEGDSAYGPVYGEAVTDVRAMVSAVIRTVRDRQGRETTSTAQVLTAPDVECPPESRITLPDGRTTRVIAVGPHTAPGLPLPESLEVNCE